MSVAGAAQLIVQLAMPSSLPALDLVLSSSIGVTIMLSASLFCTLVAASGEVGSLTLVAYTDHSRLRDLIGLDLDICGEACDFVGVRLCDLSCSGNNFDLSSGRGGVLEVIALRGLDSVNRQELRLAAEQRAIAKSVISRPS